MNDMTAANNGRQAANRQRAAALNHVAQLCMDGHRDHVLRWLIPEMVRHPALAKIRLWQLDSMMFGSSQSRAVYSIRKARDLINDDSGIRSGHATLGWALDTQADTQRMTAWLWVLTKREKLTDTTLTPPDGFPYLPLFNN